MNKLKKVVSFVLLGIMTLGICGCDEAELKRISESNRDAKHVSISQYKLNRKIEDCTGTFFFENRHGKQCSKNR